MNRAMRSVGVLYFAVSGLAVVSLGWIGEATALAGATGASPQSGLPGEASLDLSDPTESELRAQGVVIRPSGAAAEGFRGLTFPVRKGRVGSVRSGVGVFELAGGFFVRTSRRQLAVAQLRVAVGRRYVVSGVVSGKRVPVFVGRARPRQTAQTWSEPVFGLTSGTRVRLAAEAARTFRRELGRRVFRPGRELGFWTTGVRAHAVGGQLLTGSVTAEGRTLGDAAPGDPGEWGFPLVRGVLDPALRGRVTHAGGVTLTNPSIPAATRMTALTVDTRRTPARVSALLGGQHVTFATFEIDVVRRRVVKKSVELSGIEAALTPDGASLLNQQLALEPPVAAGDRFIGLTLFAPLRGMCQIR